MFSFINKKKKTRKPESTYFPYKSSRNIYDIFRFHTVCILPHTERVFYFCIFLVSHRQARASLLRTPFRWNTSVLWIALRKYAKKEKSYKMANKIIYFMCMNILLNNRNQVRKTEQRDSTKISTKQKITFSKTNIATYVPTLKYS